MKRYGATSDQTSSDELRELGIAPDHAYNVGIDEKIVLTDPYGPSKQVDIGIGTVTVGSDPPALTPARLKRLGAVLMWVDDEHLRPASTAG